MLAAVQDVRQQTRRFGLSRFSCTAQPFSVATELQDKPSGRDANHNREGMTPGVETEEENMKQLWVGIVAVACAASLGAAAQTPSQTTPTRSSSQSAAKQVTVTGCVQRASASPSGATGTTGTTGASSSAEPSFILANASSGSPSSAAPSATGTSGSASSYRLDGDDAKLTPHIGHKVEVTGEVESMPSSSAPAGSSSSASAPKLKVDTIRMVAASCSE
jgi:hypothetical protein